MIPPRGAVAGMARGFSLVEVLVALVVVSVGLLGLAKMESLALVSTNVAGSRSIAAIQASSLAAAMHANRGYWGAGRAPASTTIDPSKSPVISDTGLMAAATCTTAGSSACSVDQMAAYDVQAWATAVGKVLPAYIATIACNTVAYPVNCTISISWAENAVAANSTQSAAAMSLAPPTYTLYVQP